MLDSIKYWNAHSWVEIHNPVVFRTSILEAPCHADLNQPKVGCCLVVLLVEVDVFSPVSQPALPGEKIGERCLCLTVDNHVRGHMTFPGMCGKWYDWLLHYHANSMFLSGYNFGGFSTGGMRWDNVNHFEKHMAWVRASFAQILFKTATKISSMEGRVPHSMFELRYWCWTTKYRLTLPSFAGVASH